jgi:hypothetical protein
MEKDPKYGDPIPSSPRLVVRLEGLDTLHAIATDAVRTNNLRVSWTEFNDNVLQDEETSVSPYNTNSSLVRLSDTQRRLPHRGFYDPARVKRVQEELVQLGVGVESEIRETWSNPVHNEIKIVRGNAVIRVDFGSRSLADFETANGLRGIEHYGYNDAIFVSLDNNYDITPKVYPFVNTVKRLSLD